MRDYTLTPESAADLISMWLGQNRINPEEGFPVSGDALRTNRNLLADAAALVTLDPAEVAG
jgi:hypothetical protein